jgi:hypothetical protein
MWRNFSRATSFRHLIIGNHSVTLLFLPQRQSHKDSVVVLNADQESLVSLCLRGEKRANYLNAYDFCSVQTVGGVTFSLLHSRPRPHTLSLFVNGVPQIPPARHPLYNHADEQV